MLYESQCWRGDLDNVLATIRIRRPAWLRWSGRLRRSVPAWLLFLLWLEISAIFLMVSWFRMDAEGLIDNGTYIMMSNSALLLVMVGVGLWGFKKYGVLTGLSVFLMGVVIWQAS